MTLNCDGEKEQALHVCNVATYMLNKRSKTSDKGWSSRFERVFYNNAWNEIYLRFRL